MEIFTRPATIWPTGFILHGQHSFIQFDTCRTEHQNNLPSFKKLRAKISNVLLEFFRPAGHVWRPVVGCGRS
jgi:hypothetical protein